MIRRCLAPALALALALPGALRAQEDPRQAIDAGLIAGYDELAAASELLARAREPGGEELRARAEERLAAACAAYERVLGALDQLGEGGVGEAERARVRQVTLYNLACARALRGERSLALTALDQALEAGYDDLERLGRDADLDRLRGEPRFVQLLARARSRLEAAAREAGAQAVGQAALFPYDLDVTALDGRRLRLADLRGKVVIVDYWGTWCPPCRAEIPHFVALAAKYGDRLAVVGLAWEHGQSGAEVEERLRRFAEETGIRYPIALLSDRRALDAVPDLEGFPTTLFLDKGGRVRVKEVGYRDLEALEQLFLALDAEAAPPPAEAPPGPDPAGPF